MERTFLPDWEGDTCHVSPHSELAFPWSSVAKSLRWCAPLFWISSAARGVLTSLGGCWASSMIWSRSRQLPSHTPLFRSPWVFHSCRLLVTVKVETDKWQTRAKYHARQTESGTSCGQSPHLGHTRAQQAVKQRKYLQDCPRGWIFLNPFETDGSLRYLANK